jgi:hypothetical protein
MMAGEIKDEVFDDEDEALDAGGWCLLGHDAPCEERVEIHSASIHSK